MVPPSPLFYLFPHIPFPLLLSAVLPENLHALKEIVDVVRSVSERFTGAFKWLKSRTMMTKALLDWGQGGSTSAAVDALRRAAESARYHRLPYEESLSHLYAGILCQKGDHGTQGNSVEHLKKVLLVDVSCGCWV